MIPKLITKKNIDTALSHVLHEGVPSRRRGRDYCLVADGKHFPPKYTIALAHRIATGEFLSSDRFSGGRESNDFLERRGFDVIKCDCGGVRHDRRRSPATARSERGRDARSHRDVILSAAGNARSECASCWSASTEPAWSTTNFAGKPASPHTVEPRSNRRCGRWPPR